MNTKKLKELARRATGGIWKAFINEKTNTFAIHTPDDARCGNIVDWMGYDGVNCSKKQKAHNARFIAASNPAVVIQLIDALEAAERERDELRGKYQEVSGWYAKMKTRMLSAEAELPRGDSVADEPDYWQFKSVNGDWIGIGESGMRQAVSEGVEVRPLYTAALPAVLPGEVEELSMLIRRLVHSLKNSNPHSGLLISVPDYMRRKGFWKSTDCMRGDDVKQG
ncbi:ead/Ea22-like family protein [Erwinia aphidicola]|uniref:ead/Ea22-like family protein n=1 Tax=Erwinia aphidicola TaxID=68334 RepID=UPI0030159A0F